MLLVTQRGIIFLFYARMLFLIFIHSSSSKSNYGGSLKCYNILQRVTLVLVIHSIKTEVSQPSNKDFFQFSSKDFHKYWSLKFCVLKPNLQLKSGYSIGLVSLSWDIRVRMVETKSGCFWLFPELQGSAWLNRQNSEPK